MRIPTVTHPFLHVRLAPQVELALRGRENLAVLGVQPAEERRAHHSAMADDPHALTRKRIGRAIRHGRA